jgi:hypothetical protein
MFGNTRFAGAFALELIRKRNTIEVELIDHECGGSVFATASIAREKYNEWLIRHRRQ